MTCTAVVQEGELGLPFAQRIIRRAVSLIPASFVPVPFARAPDWGSEASEEARFWRP
jgi:hypothetical protein